MIEVLYFSDRAVKQKLFARVTAAKRLTLVTVLPPHRAAKSPQKLEPFASLEREFAGTLDQVLVVDEGTIEGMWRDPVVDLADALYPSDAKAAYAAARGYFFVLGGEAKATVKKSADEDADLERLEKVVERLSLKRSAKADPASTVEDGPAAVQTAVPGADPFAVLGLPQGSTLAEAKRAWKELIVQYHPDKVAHLAPEFRQLAEKKTRELMVAWEQVQAALRS